MQIIRVGRNQENDVILQAPQVSGSHADIYIYDNGAMQIIDHSTNGTYIDGKFVHNSAMAVMGHEVLNFPGNITVPLAELIPQQSGSGTIIQQGFQQNAMPVMDMNNVPSAQASKKNPIGFGEAFTNFFQNYANFEGRATRSEFWYMVLWNVIFGIIPFVDFIWFLVVFLPMLAVAVRRLHDIGKSGWYYCVGLIPLVGPILMIVWYCTDSQPGNNKYGAYPK